MLIYIETIVDNKIYELYCEPTDSIHLIKIKIKYILHLDFLYYAVLIFKSIFLTDYNKSISDYNITNNSKLYLDPIRLRG